MRWFLIGILIFLFVFVAFCSCTPVSAASNTSPSAYAPLAFDSISFTDSLGSPLTFAWDGSVVPYDDNLFIQTDYALLELYGAADYGETTTVDFQGVPNFTLIGGAQVVNLESLQSFVVDATFHDDFVYRINYEFTYYELKLVAGEYILAPRFVSGFLSQDEDGLLAIGRRLSDEIFWGTPDNRVYIGSVKLFFTCISGPVDSAGAFIRFSFDSQVVPADSTVTAYFNGLPLAYENVIEQVVVEDAHVNSWFDWLLNAIRAFLQTPLFGNFSIGGLLEINLCIGIAVLIAKVI